MIAPPRTFSSRTLTFAFALAVTGVAILLWREAYAVMAAEAMLMESVCGAAPPIAVPLLGHCPACWPALIASALALLSASWALRPARTHAAARGAGPHA